jgi:hypothetical protein
VARRLSSELAGAPADEALVDLTAADELSILLVDDRPANIRTLEEVLAPLG